MIRFIDLATLTPEGVYREIETSAKEVGFTMYALCLDADVCPETVQKWKNKNQEPSFRIVRTLIEAVQSKPVLKKQ